MAIAELKKGDKVILKGFTGIKLGVFEITAASKKTLTITKSNGDEMVFDRKTGKQINVEEGKERYANSIMEDDGSYVKPERKKATPAKKAKKVEPVEEADEADESDEEDEVPVKKTKKAAKKPAKKTVKAPEPEEDEEYDEDDEFEEIED